jgi:hypothetical protein
MGERMKSKVEYDLEGIDILFMSVFFIQIFINVFLIGSHSVWVIISSVFNVFLMVFIVMFFYNKIQKNLIITKLTISNIALTFLVFPLIILSTYIHFFPVKNKDAVNEYTNLKIPHVFLGKACRIEGECLEDVAVLYGGINKESKESFEVFINKNLVETVCLSSGGGRINEANAISGIIIEKKLNTCMADYYYYKEDVDHINPIMSLGCSSACNFLLLSSDVRIRNAALVRFQGHQYAVTNSYSQKFERWGWGWKYISSNISEEPPFKWYYKYFRKNERPSIVSDFKKLKTKDNAEHVLYAEKLEKIGHLSGMKKLTNKTLKEFKIFTEVIPAK